ncbi:7-beta-(4-carbaxybutanamido)cephalosporanic acid acylase [Polymorphobacter multimanifer]|uniref:Acyl-homoserine-lactone acylase n=1 Tax=Polymorphobacter multimanifer TaxID=1070431 RepID=A0A841L9S6_9SPHN|nr:penicillin acylase family protein [Polymorphobacter multimanifer]MBB6229397.1 acyl-homoserine-lactone acylase [Polymorphobacter multimanifer]GGI89589.1 7-beta-(4-carbaxybutanamido)cephalosporanic acid acylase [Polymorphobacter multimanifer]
MKIGFLAALPLLALPLLAPAFAAPTPTPAPAFGGGEILWDRYGVPHVYAKTEAGAFYGFGWAQAQSHGDILLKMYGESRARGAEYWGPDAEKLDRWLIANDVPTRSIAWYEAQTPAMRRNLDAFAAGINAYAAAHPQAIAAEMRQVLPIRGVDIIGHAHRLMNYNYIASENRVLAAAGPVGEGEAPEGSDGSNAWAVMPGRTAAGKTLLLANPHLPWAPSMLTYYEAHLTAPGYSVYGGTQVGLPVVRFAFNDNLGFTNTVNTILGFTRYELKLEGDGYRFDGKVLPFKTAQKSYKVRQPDGTLKTVSFTQRTTVHGPVFEMPDGKTPGSGPTIALKVAGLDRPGVLQQYLDMGKAQDWKAFEAALKTLQVPTFNIIYADRAGHVLYLDNGILPKHKTGGDYRRWAGLVPGDTSETLWTDIHSYEDMPKVFDPPGGFVQNANDGPWVSTWPRTLKPAEWPAHVVQQTGMSMRAQMSVKLLAGTDKISWDDFVSRKLTTTSLMAERMIPALIDAIGTSDDADLAQAKLLLAGWDRKYEADSKAGLLFETWAKLFAGPALTGQGGFATGWSLDDAIQTPNGLKDPAGAVAMLKQAVADTRKLYGAVDRPFGEVSRLKVAEGNLPGHGGLGNLGIFRVMTWSPLKDGERSPVHGETWVSMVEFGTPMKAVGLMSYGNASQPGSKHRADQLPMVEKKQFRTLWRDRKDIEANLEERVTF